ncbi:hypothetical protein [Polycladidibacter hongkongensis]|uniref:hypothetical protein n=1 Tax=Polycladidibacter hongkongensis TaxID=1647556 RepID=UPI000834B122|nr:hypothetical protein [Pseudovibrio hongkongensis]
MSMTATAVDFGQLEKTEKSFLRRAFERIVEARQIEAKRVANHYLLQLDDETLAQTGFNREALKAEGSKISFL